MSAPRTKRQFAGAASDPAQRQITSFFGNGASPPSPSINNQNTRTLVTSSLGPQLPASVQSNLLSVGMRVRKSVPEGYKTGNYSAFSLWDEGNSGVPTASTTIMGEGRSRANAISTPRELIPFCGIHRVGGLDTQSENLPSLSIPSTTYQPVLSVNGLPLDDSMNDDVPGLTSSQETVESTDSAFSPAKTRKRSYTEDENETPDTPGRLSLNVNIWRDNFDGEISPRSLAPVGWGPSNGRIMAVPRKTKFRQSKLGAGFRAQIPDQENVMVVDDAEHDFEEAEFLVKAAELGYTDSQMSDV
ncbi:ribonucleotide reductase inhibitor-domain-containing protein [Hypoxylon fragiforme]|uniref:ribonucleotide reductase inhibitor-domain-containing protein n=1 Tax=Hypoxylon fragiforme TaxID=63214 RepID=UPI0020C60728|nr:ribonucleotide reductase inhibitor-domain-containing protein [Hypoxylon fragiforme]KAI2605252.1 ribonucleotide reductase inhibitor-domain-containing protein [Hypoxylon fragiforme]